jgi:hypothetical protein
MHSATRGLVVAVTLSLAVPAVAEVRLGGLGNLNFARQSINNLDAGITSESERRWGAGGLVSFSLGEHVSLVLEPTLLRKGGGLAQPAFGARVSGRLTYVEIPAWLKVSLGRGSLRPYLLAGPTVGFLRSARLRLTVDGTLVSQDDVTADTRSLDFGVGAGGGLAVSARRAELFAEGQYVFGLVNLDTTGEEVIKNRGLQLRVGISFRLGR